MTEETVTLDLCRQAICDAARNKKDKKEVLKILSNLDIYAEDIRQMVLKNTFRPSPYMVCKINDRSSGKIRTLHKPAFYPDQIVGHVCILLIQPLLLRRLDSCCIASIKGKGIIYGYKSLKSWLNEDRKGTKYCLKGDVRKCYESIKPYYILATFKKFIKDERYLSLVRKIVYSIDSLPLGNYTSAWFANLLLSQVDRLARLDRCCKHYVRYLDDFVILGPNKRKLHRLLVDLQAAAAAIGLDVKDNWQIFPVAARGIDFMGYRFYPGYILLRRRNALKFMRQCRRIKRRGGATVKMARSFMSRYGQLRWFNSHNFINKHLGGIDIPQIRSVISNADRNHCNSS